jgi:hypothetical protein
MLEKSRLMPPKADGLPTRKTSETSSSTLALLPQPGRFVPRRRDDALAVGAERRAPHKTPMAFEWLAHLLASLGVPQPSRLVISESSDDTLAVGAKRRTPHFFPMALQRPADLPAGLDVPTGTGSRSGVMSIIVSASSASLLPKSSV